MILSNVLTIYRMSIKLLKSTNPDRERNILIVIHDKNFDMLSNKKLNEILIDLMIS